MPFIHSFKPIADGRSRVLILGSVPGPEALRRKEYYGFPNNHFWKILFQILGAKPTLDYRQKVRLLKEHRVALWDVIGRCTREGASDSRIRAVRPNNLVKLIRRTPGLAAIFLNGRTAEKLYRRYFGGTVRIPVFYLPSTSPAHAALSYQNKLKRWSVIKKYLVKKKRLVPTRSF